MKKTHAFSGLFTFLGVVLGFAALAIAGISTTRTLVTTKPNGGRVLLYTSVVTADTAGAAVGTFNLGKGGKIIRATSAPYNLSTLPLAAWDCVLTDGMGNADVLQGGALNRIASATHEIYQAWTSSSVDTTNVGVTQPTAPWVYGVGKWTCSNMGTSRQTTMKLVVEEMD